MSTIPELSTAHFLYFYSLTHQNILNSCEGRKNLALIRWISFERAKTVFQHCQSAAVERLKFSVFPRLYLWGKGWVGRSYVCKGNKWHFVLSFSGCEISLVQTESRMLSWEQGTCSDNHLKILPNQPHLPSLSYRIHIFPLAGAMELLSFQISSSQRLPSWSCAEQWLGTRPSLVSMCWTPPRTHGEQGEKVAPCPQRESWHKVGLCSGRQGDNCWVAALSLISGRPNLLFLRELMVFISFGTCISDILFRRSPAGERLHYSSVHILMHSHYCRTNFCLFFSAVCIWVAFLPPPMIPLALLVQPLVPLRNG